jgi:hypothetical protein
MSNTAAKDIRRVGRGWGGGFEVLTAILMKSLDF